MKDLTPFLDAAIIDLDGTMVDTMGDFVVAINLMLHDLGYDPVARAVVEVRVGKGSENLVKSVLNHVSDQQIRAQAAPEFVAPVSRPIASATPVATLAAPVATAPVPTSLPKVTSYDLPLQDLVQVAQSSGLQWVNSDSAKIAEAQAAMAAEVKPAHVPRERPPVVATTEGPLVLVETRRDLREMALPFEKPAA